MILQEFDYDKEAILNPTDLMEAQILEKGLKEKMPKVAVSCFERKKFERVLKQWVQCETI